MRSTKVRAIHHATGEINHVTVSRINQKTLAWTLPPVLCLQYAHCSVNGDRKNEVCRDCHVIATYAAGPEALFTQTRGFERNDDMDCHFVGTCAGLQAHDDAVGGGTASEVAHTAQQVAI